MRKIILEKPSSEVRIEVYKKVLEIAKVDGDVMGRDILSRLGLCYALPMVWLNAKYPFNQGYENLDYWRYTVDFFPEFKERYEYMKSAEIAGYELTEVMLKLWRVDTLEQSIKELEKTLEDVS